MFEEPYAGKPHVRFREGQTTSLHEINHVKGESSCLLDRKASRKNGKFVIFQGAGGIPRYNSSGNAGFISNPEISRGGYRCITTGRLYPDKNPLFLLDVFEQIHLFKPEAELTWVGTGRMKNELEDLIRKKNIDNCVHLIGEQKHPESFLKEADIFLFPSLFEALGMALVEAQAAGLECYASDRIPRIVDCGKCRFLSLDLSAKEWAERIIADTDTGNKMKLDEDKLRQFDIHTMTHKLSKIYLTGSVNNMSQDG